MTSSMRIAQYMIILPYGYFDDLLRQTEELSEDTRVLDSLIQEYDGICGFFIRFQCVFLMEEVPEEITGEMQIRQYMYEKAGEFQGKLREDGEDSGLIIMGYDDHAGLFALGVDLVDGGENILLGVRLHMTGDDVRTGIAELLHIADRALDHQMDIQGHERACHTF